MSGLKTYEMPDLEALDTDDDGFRVVKPGARVRHRHDPTSLGLALSRRQHPDTDHTVCEVLWTKQPWTVVPLPKEAVHPPPVPAHAVWTRRSTYRDREFFEAGSVKSIPYREWSEDTFDGTEEYLPGQLTTDNVHRVLSDHAELTCHSDGMIVVQHRDVPKHRLPSYTQHPDLMEALGGTRRQWQFRG